MKKMVMPLAVVLTLTAITSISAGFITADPAKDTVKLYINGSRLSAELSGTQEAPTMGDPDGSGYVELELNSGLGTIEYTLTVENIAMATAAHIHIGPAGSPGPVVVPLSAPSSGSSSGTIEVDKELIKAIRKNPEAYYVNVHNATYPGGAVRGQLSK